MAFNPQEAHLVTGLGAPSTLPNGLMFGDAGAMAAGGGFAPQPGSVSMLLPSNNFASNALMSNGVPVLRGNAARNDWSAPTASGALMQVRARLGLILCSNALAVRLFGPLPGKPCRPCCYRRPCKICRG